MELVEKVRQLIEVMASHDLAELEVEEEGMRVHIIKKQPVPSAAAPVAFPYGQMQQVPGGQVPQLQAGSQPAEEPDDGRDEGLLEVASPMVGTFYRSPSPGAEAYVGIGSEVEEDSVVCIIEAMKVMNEIKAEVEGKIVEILVEDAEPVEYGQVLFLVEPAEG